jgi:hypothetical protein
MQDRSWLRTATLVALLGGVALVLPAACGGNGGTTTDASVDVTTTTCAAPLLQCGAECSDPQSDPNNCGACGTKCDTTNAQVCSQGKCALACGGGTSQCGSSCFDLQTDPNNCGKCGQACPQGQACSMGQCGVACSAGLTQCGDAGACVDTNTDALNCGTCGNVCGPNTTCATGACAANLLTTAPVNVSGTLTGCSTNYSATGHKTLIDDTHALYVSMSCGGTLYVTRSGDGGITFSTPVSTGLTNVVESAIAVSHGAKPSLYAAAATTTAVMFSSSADLGVTWSTPVTIDPAISAGLYGMSVAVYNGTVYVQANPSGGGQFLHVLRDGTGIGDAGLVDADDAGFALTTVFVDAGAGGGPFPNQVLADPTGNVWALSEDGTLFVTESTNGGASFSQFASPPGSQHFSSWALANGTLFATGDNDPLYVIPTASPSTDTTITGLGISITQQRSIAVDANGNVYVAFPSGNNVVLDRILYATATTDGGVTDGGGIESSRKLWGLDGVASPSVSSGPANTAFIGFTANGAVYATVQAY